MEQIEEKCSHPANRNFAWFALNHETGKEDILCVACCDCGAVLQGAPEEEQ